MINNNINDDDNEISLSIMQSFYDDINDHWIQSKDCKYYHYVPNDVDFIRDVVSQHIPCIINGMINDWPALENWDYDYLIRKTNNQIVNVNFTKKGDADSIINIDDEKYFIYPTEIQMPMNDFINMIRIREDDDAIPYLSQQDDNLRKHFPTLLDDISIGLPLANNAFKDVSLEDEKNTLTAANLWIGDERSVSSIHKDFYENFYCVITGEKSFHLFPPSDIAFMNEEKYKTKRYNYKKTDENRNNKRIKQSDIDIISDDSEEEVSWIANDPTQLSSSSYFKDCHPITLTLKKGETLYLPAMWYHRVSQLQPTIAVNFWYEQRFDHRFVHYQLARKLSQLYKKLNLHQIDWRKNDTHDDDYDK